MVLLSISFDCTCYYRYYYYYNHYYYLFKLQPQIIAIIKLIIMHAFLGVKNWNNTQFFDARRNWIKSIAVTAVYLQMLYRKDAPHQFVTPSIIILNIFP